MRISVARRNLFRQKTRLVMSVGGVGFSVALILIVWGLFASFQTKMTAYLESIPADVWVTQAGSPVSMFGGGGTARIPVETADSLLFIDGVDSIRPFVGNPVQFEHRGADAFVFLIGVDLEDPITAPPVSSGRAVPRPGEIVVDGVFAHNREVGIGDTLVVKDNEVRIVGLSEGTDLMGSQFAFVEMSTLTRIGEADMREFAPEMMGMGGDTAGYFLVRASGDPEVVVARIEEQAPQFRALTSDEFVQANLATMQESIQPILWVLVMIAFAVGAAVTGLTIYTATVEKAREYGVLKAIGFTNLRLFRVVGVQSMVAALLGFVVGTIMTFTASGLLENRYPIFTVYLTPAALAFVLVLCLIMSATAALLPARRLASIDPAEVFRV